MEILCTLIKGGHTSAEQQHKLFAYLLWNDDLSNNGQQEAFIESNLVSSCFFIPKWVENVLFFLFISQTSSDQTLDWFVSSGSVCPQLKSVLKEPHDLGRTFFLSWLISILVLFIWGVTSWCECVRVIELVEKSCFLGNGRGVGRNFKVVFIERSRSPKNNFVTSSFHEERSRVCSLCGDFNSATVLFKIKRTLFLILLEGMVSKFRTF